MKQITVTVVCAALFAIGGNAFADEMAKDGVSKDAMAKHDQMMKDCMAKQPSSMAPDAAKKACESKVKKDQMGNMSRMGNDSNSHP